MTERVTTLARTIQRRLEVAYGLDETPHVAPFVDTEEGAREALFLRESGDDVEIRVRLPDVPERPSFDVLCQIVEGVSHFVYLCTRIEAGVPATFLELEIQAEVDKFVVLGGRDARPRHRFLDRLFDAVSFVHDDGTEPGDRYRTANRLAARFCAKLPEDAPRSIARLRAFYRGRQDEKLRLAAA